MKLLLLLPMLLLSSLQLTATAPPVDVLENDPFSVTGITIVTGPDSAGQQGHGDRRAVSSIRQGKRPYKATTVITAAPTGSASAGSAARRRTWAA